MVWQDGEGGLSNCLFPACRPQLKRFGLYSSQDADSEGVEGKYFVWTPEEIRAALGPSTASSAPLALRSESPAKSAGQAAQDDAQLFIEAYGVTEGGNFEGKNI